MFCEAQCVKTLIVKGESTLIALVLRGDHELNHIKTEKLDGVISPLEFADEDEIKKQIGCGLGSIGPINLSIPVYVDLSDLDTPGTNCSNHAR